MGSDARLSPSRWWDWMPSAATSLGAIIATARLDRPLAELQAEQERLLRRLGLPAETRKFVPHVTLARLRQTSPMAVANYLSMRGWLASRTFEADHFTLYSSRDSVGGGPYVTEAAYPLVT